MNCKNSVENLLWKLTPKKVNIFVIDTNYKTEKFTCFNLIKKYSILRAKCDTKQTKNIFLSCNA